MIPQELFTAMNPGYVIVSLYLLVSANYLVPLFSCQVRNLIEGNIFITHLLGYFTMLFLIVITGIKKQAYLPVILYTGLLYIWFILTSRMDLMYWYITLALLSVIYLLYLYTKVEDIQKEELEKIEKSQKILSLIALVITLFGTLVYLGEKRIEYGKAFDWTIFLFGKSKCRGKSPNVDIWTSLKAVVGRSK